MGIPPVREEPVLTRDILVKVPGNKLFVKYTPDIT
jgi:hypothetical protein